MQTAGKAVPASCTNDRWQPQLRVPTRKPDNAEMVPLEGHLLTHSTAPVSASEDTVSTSRRAALPEKGGEGLECCPVTAFTASMASWLHGRRGAGAHLCPRGQKRGFCCRPEEPQDHKTSGPVRKRHHRSTWHVACGKGRYAAYFGPGRQGSADLQVLLAVEEEAGIEPAPRTGGGSEQRAEQRSRGGGEPHTSASRESSWSTRLAGKSTAKVGSTWGTVHVAERESRNEARNRTD